jgi:hypothetical protein
VSCKHGETDGLGQRETPFVKTRTLLFALGGSIGVVSELTVEGPERRVGLVEGRERGRDGVALRDVDGFHVLSKG